MGAAAVKAIQRNTGTLSHHDLLALASLHDPGARAISFYLSAASFSERSQQQELTAIKQLGRSILRSHLDQYPRSNDLLADLDAVIESAEGIQKDSLGFKAIFACRGQKAWREFNLATRADIRLFEAGERFRLFPLLQAMESCCDTYQQKLHIDLLNKVRKNPSHNAIGLKAVLEKLARGCVDTLLLGPQLEAHLIECVQCGHLSMDGVHSCPSCDCSELATVNAHEALIRKALETNAAIVPITGKATSLDENVAALLRY